MATISSKLIFDADARLAGCGIDAEYVDRFTRWVRDGREISPMIFSLREIDYCASLSDQPAGLCASFCCKEAVFKALGEPFNGPECELFWMPGTDRHPIGLSEQLRSEFRISEGRAHIRMQASGVCLVQAYLFGEGV